ncbi:MAG TPA: ubiquinol-cytochrome c reductase iron-sulfur subunit [Bryobacterales bacterium]|nr:ubiquinol-cytochrome c reductase iron-sulfur subunit [Bryobacterales bacterium]
MSNDPPAPERRSLIRILLGTGLGASIVSFLYPALKFMMPPAVAESAVNQVVAGNVADLKPNTGLVFKFGSKPALLVRTAEDKWLAFSAICTHLGCTVQYQPQTQQIWCPCHNGMFDLNGKVASGPPPRPLEGYAAHVQGDKVIVSRA